MCGGRGKAFAAAEVTFDVPRERAGLGDVGVIRQWKGSVSCSSF
jgi:hypothetical protein